MRRCRLCCLVVALVAGRAGAQARDSAPQPVFSMGQPPLWQPYVAPLAFTGGSGGAGGAVSLGVRRPITNPVVGKLAASAELLGGWTARQASAEARFLANVPAVGLSAGIDWSLTRGTVGPLYSFSTAVRRGGLFGGGSMLRLDWLPTRRRTFALGAQVPLAQPFAGRTRPRRTQVDLPAAHRVKDRAIEPLPDSIEHALATLAQTATLIRAYSSLWFDADRAALDSGARLPFGRTYDGVSSAYRDALVRAFHIASELDDRDVGERIATHARAAVLDRVILPYDALFGRVKKQPGIGGLIDDAHDQFAQWVSDSSRVPIAMHARVVAVFDRWTETIADIQRTLAGEWKDSRFIWLPPALALTPEEYDEQSEVEALIGRAVGHPFTDDNAIAHFRTLDVHLEIARSITAARTYHVLWTHDFTGRRDFGELDDVAYTIVADAYLPALTKAVERYDSTGVLTQYFILLDAYYYHGRESHLWMDILENPLDPHIALHAGEEAQAEHLRQRVAELRSAVSQSVRLQREAAERGGERWLKEVVRVNVNIGLPSDFSFRSVHIAPPLPFVPDNVMRDHRKIVMYDFTEANPYDGAMIVSGVGIGEHYASATWQDRGLRLRGPAALEARAALRRALLGNGFREDRIPPVLRVTTGHVAAGERGARRADITRAVNVHNEPGFGAKMSSVARAMLYSLTPPGSVIVVPDPVWLSEPWAAMLVGAAARGSNVAIIAPALANAPSPEVPILVLERQLLKRLLTLQRDVPRWSNDDGALHVGIFAAKAAATDVAGRLAEVRAGLQENPWIREMIPFDAHAIASLDAAVVAEGQIEAGRPPLGQDVEPREPQLHQKTLFIARPGAVAALLRQSGWEGILARTMRSQAAHTARLSDAIGAEAPEADTAAARATEELLDGYERSLSEADRKRISFFYSIGSQNQDVRSLALDGESVVILSGFPATAGLVDLYYLMARTTWVEHSADVDRLVPMPRGWLARFARWFRDVL